MFGSVLSNEVIVGGCFDEALGGGASEDDLCFTTAHDQRLLELRIVAHMTCAHPRGRMCMTLCDFVAVSTASCESL